MPAGAGWTSRTASRSGCSSTPLDSTRAAGAATIIPVCTGCISSEATLTPDRTGCASSEGRCGAGDVDCGLEAERVCVDCSAVLPMWRRAKCSSIAANVPACDANSGKLLTCAAVNNPPDGDPQYSTTWPAMVGMRGPSEGAAGKDPECLPAQMDEVPTAEATPEPRLRLPTCPRDAIPVAQALWPGGGVTPATARCWKAM